MSKHTDGKWELDIGSLGALYIMADGYEIAEVQGPDADDECLANARLIAASPDMLSELKEARLILKEHGIGDYAWESIDAAINKAEGSTA